MSKNARYFDRFDTKGRPLSSYEAMEKRIKFLEGALDRLARIIRSRAPLKPVVDSAEQHQTLH